MALTSFLTGAVGTPTPSTYQPAQLKTGSAVVQDNLTSFLNPNSDYIKQATQQGLETAATRGGINSSIAAGTSRRAAQEVAGNLAQQATSIDQNREQVQAENWMNQQNFSRALQGQLTGQVFTNSLNMLSAVQNYALEDPELYTPEVVSGLTNFFTKNMNNLLGKYYT